MKTLNTLLTAATLVLAASYPAVAAPAVDKVSFGDPAIAGSGCPEGTSSYSMNPRQNGQTLIILFKAYSAAPGNATCNMAIPVTVPNGFQVAIMTADYRGFSRGSAELTRSYFFAGSAGPSLRTEFSSSDGKDYLQRDNQAAMDSVFSECGQDVNLRMNSRIRTKNENASVKVKSLALRLRYRACSSS